MSRILLLFFLFFVHVQNSTQDDQNDCEAGQYFDQGSTKSNCRICEQPRDFKDNNTYSNDGADECTSCGKRHCICDTTSPLRYLSKDKNDKLVEKCEVAGDQLICSIECYLQCRFALTGQEYGALSKLVNITYCECVNNRTTESCLYRKNFTQTCFQNECDADGTRYYDNGTMLTTLNSTLNATLNSCYTQYSVTNSCSKSECGDALSPYLANLTTCNCYHTYKFDGDHENPIRTTTTDECEDRSDFYVHLKNLCIEEEPPIDIFSDIVVIAVVVLTIAILGGYCIAKYERYLKKSGEIRKIIPYIDWNKIEALGVAGAVVRSERPANDLSNKEIILKVRFGVMKWCFGGRFVRPQHHVVLKIFSEFQCEQQGVELEVFNSISDKSLAKDCNIISVYGPASGSSNRDLVRFLELLIAKSEGCRKLASVIRRCYLGVGATEDQPLTSPRCRYIMMNRCELSLSKFILSHEEDLPHETVLHICRDLANALDFLHERNWSGNKQRMIVHCDIKPDNIFVKKRRNTNSFKLADFGFAVVQCRGEVFRVKGSTTSFLPPEWFIEIIDGGNQSEIQKQNIESRGKFPCKIDIYQYGLIVWLALHKKLEPWVDEFEEERRRQVNPTIKKHEFLKRLFSDPETFNARPSFADNTNPVFDKLRTLAKRCWQTEVQKRPSACEILAILDHHVQAVNHV